MKSDEELLGEITELLNMIIADPDLIRNTTEAEQEPSMELLRLDNEINRTLEGFDFDKDALRKKLLMRISLKYQDIAPQTYITKRLQADFANASPLDSFSIDLFSRTVKAITIDNDGTVGIILINDQQIRKEQTNGNSTETTESSPPNTRNS